MAEKASGLRHSLFSSSSDALFRKNPDGSLVRSILQGTRITNNKAIEYEHLNEARARDLYVDHHNSKHESVKVTTTGLHMDPTQPFLAASPDGLVSCDECGEGLLEIKCSFKYCDAEPRQIAASVKDHPVSLSDSRDFQLKTLHGIRKFSVN